MRPGLGWRPRYHARYYAVFLASYVEAFRPSPRELTWRDFELYQLYLTARAEHETEMQKKYWKKQRNISKID
ncbi:MAG: hypothetical protein U9P14_04920 [Gemmatimonadota bacterium]|nr:hypothetical protein [Gemmatimonadota bacterium]